MGPASTNKAATRRAPHSGKLQQISVTSTATTTALDTDFPGNWVTVQNLGASSCRVLFGGSTVTVDFTATSGATLGFELASGQKEDWYLEDTDTYIAHDSGATCTLQIAQAG